MAKKSTPVNQVEGINIYAGKRGQILYYNIFDQKAYHISADHLTNFKLLNNKIVYGIIAIIIAHMILSLNLLLSILVGILVYAIVEWRFQALLKKCTVYPKFDKTAAERYHAKENTVKVMSVKAGLYMLIPVLMILNTFSPELRGNTVVKGGSYAIAFFSIAMSLRYVEIIVERAKKHD